MSKLAHKYLPASASDERCMQVKATGPGTSTICGEGPEVHVHVPSTLDRARATATRLEQELAECRRHLQEVLGCCAPVYPEYAAAEEWLNNSPHAPGRVGELLAAVIENGHNDLCPSHVGEPCNCPAGLAEALADDDVRNSALRRQARGPWADEEVDRG